MSFDISYSGIIDNSFSSDEINEIPYIDYDYAEGMNYTIVLISSARTKNKIVYYLVSNIPGNEVEEGDILAEYKDLHTTKKKNIYELILLEQIGQINKNRIDRYSFNLKDFIKDNDLVIIDKIILTITENKDYFDSSLTEEESKHCRCKLHLIEKQPKSCIVDKSWGESRKYDGSSTEGKCYNPYSVCSRAGKTNSKCSSAIIPESLSNSKLKVFALSQKIKVPIPFNRKKLLELVKHLQS